MRHFIRLAYSAKAVSRQILHIHRHSYLDPEAEIPTQTETAFPKSSYFRTLETLEGGALRAYLGLIPESTRKQSNPTRTPWNLFLIMSSAPTKTEALTLRVQADCVSLMYETS